MAIFKYDKNKKKFFEVKSLSDVSGSFDDNIGNYINMRNTWSGQTKVEFSQTTIDEDIKERNKR